MDGVCKALTSFLLQSDPRWQNLCRSSKLFAGIFLQGDGKPQLSCTQAGSTDTLPSFSVQQKQAGF